MAVDTIVQSRAATNRDRNIDARVATSFAVFLDMEVL